MGRDGYKDFILQFDAESGDWTQVGSTNTKTAFIGVDLVPLSEVQPYCDMVSRNNRGKIIIIIHKTLVSDVFNNTQSYKHSTSTRF